MLVYSELEAFLTSKWEQIRSTPDFFSCHVFGWRWRLRICVCEVAVCWAWRAWRDEVLPKKIDLFHCHFFEVVLKEQFECLNPWRFSIKSSKKCPQVRSFCHFGNISVKAMMFSRLQSADRVSLQCLNVPTGAVNRLDCVIWLPSQWLLT